MSQKQKPNPYAVMLLTLLEHCGGADALIETLKAFRFNKLRSGISRVEELRRLEKLQEALCAALRSPEADAFRRAGLGRIDNDENAGR